jgi:hypothetical protein
LFQALRDLFDSFDEDSDGMLTHTDFSFLCDAVTTRPATTTMTTKNKQQAHYHNHLFSGNDKRKLFEAMDHNGIYLCCSNG